MPEPVITEFPRIERSHLVETVNISPADAKSIYRVGMRFPGADVYSESFLKRGEAIESSQAMVDLMDYLDIGSRMRKLKNGRSIVLIVHGLPTDPTIPAPPIDGGTPYDKPSFVSEDILLGMAGNLGYPSILLGEKKEALIHQITPVPGQEEAQSNEGAVDLGWHQDLAPNPEVPNARYSLFMPDFLILNGVKKGSGNTETFISPLDDVLKYLDEETRKVLMEDRFITNPPDSFLKAVGEDIDLPIHPVLMEYEGHMESAVDFSSGLRTKDPNDKEALEALEKLKIALDKARQGIKIEPGTAVAFNNRRIIHGRGAVDLDTKYLNKKRWLQRIYIFDKDRIMNVIIRNHYWGLHIGPGVIRATPYQILESERLMEMAKKAS